MDTPRIYVACLAAYNNAKLHGEWIDATQDPDDIQAAIKAMLAKSPEAGAEEWAIHDSEGFGSLKVDENESIDDVSAAAKFIAEHGELAAAFLSQRGTADVSEAPEYLREQYRGAWGSLGDYAEDLITECYDLKGVPECIKYHIDWDGIGRDMELNGEIWTIELNGEVHVFAEG